MRPPKPRRDMSGNPGNPTSELQKAYSQLMTITDPDQLVEAAVGIVKPLIGRGFSEKNFRLFMQNIEQSKRRGLESIQSFLSNYILRGSGLGVESKEHAIASVLTEDIDDYIELTPYQQSLKAMVESHGFHVGIKSNDGFYE